MSTHKKSRSTRAKPHDWAALLEAVLADTPTGPAMIIFEERYVHAIQKALVGRDNRPLLDLLDRKELIHPALLPALADVIHSQKDGAVGVGERLTVLQDQQIRFYFDAFTKHDSQPAKGIKADLAKLFSVSVRTIERSLEGTKPPKR